MIDVARCAEYLIPVLPHAHFTICGDGEQRKEFETFIKEKGIQDHFELKGWVKEEKVYEMLNPYDYDVFLLTSLWEGLPRSMLQAGSVGIPCVCYAVNGVSEVLLLGETGWPVPVGDYKMAASAILWIRNHPMRAMEIGKVCSRFIREEFDIDKMVRQQEDLYMELAKEKGLI